MYVGMSPVGPAHENYNIIICAYNITKEIPVTIIIYHYFIILLPLAHAIRGHYKLYAIVLYYV